MSTDQHLPPVTPRFLNDSEREAARCVVLDRATHTHADWNYRYGTLADAQRIWGLGLFGALLLPATNPLFGVDMIDILPIGGAMATLCGGGLYLTHRAIRRNRQRWDAARPHYGFTTDESETILDNAPEITLATVATDFADTISTAEAWADPILESHRLRFDPEHEAAEIREHALNIAALRIRLGGRDVATDTTVTAARSHINTLLETLTDRVAALWACADNIDRLTEPIRDLRAIRDAIDALPAIDTVARQKGVAERATRELQRLTYDADTTTRTVEKLTADLTKRLPLPDPTQGEARE